jgi:hypothetical protein
MYKTLLDCDIHRLSLHFKDRIPKFETNIPRKETVRSQSQFPPSPNIYVSVSHLYTYSYNRFAYSAAVCVCPPSG